MVQNGEVLKKITERLIPISKIILSFVLDYLKPNTYVRKNERTSQRDHC